MEEMLNRLSDCIEFGKSDKHSPYPPDMKDKDGAAEITQQLLDSGVPAEDILSKALINGMEKVGIKFRENTIFIPQVLMAARAMNAAMHYLKPLFAASNTKRKGTFIIGTVDGDLHDIGKNLVAMIVEGNGYEVVDLGTDVKSETFLAAAEKHPGSTIGLSALLTTTMVNMGEIVKAIKENHPERVVCIGGAPVNTQFCNSIGADFYSPDPQGLVEFLNNLPTIL